MIEKLDLELTLSVATNHCIINKINELVDAVNTIQKEREAERFEIQEWIGILEAVRKSVNIHEKQIDELQMKVEPEKATISKMENVEPAENVQPDAETRPENVQDPTKWVGKLCRFRHGLGVTPTYGILGEILPNSVFPYYKKDTDTYWKYCEPVKPTDSIIYKGGNNE